MIKETYVSFEIAKLLKEKGFDEICYLGYNRNGEYVPTSNRTNSQIIQPDFCFICCPTLQMAMKWLREIHRLHIYPDYIDFIVHDKVEVWVVKIIDMKTFKEYSLEYSESSYEQACEAAIKYCLKNLI